jgi:hypothetical protein
MTAYRTPAPRLEPPPRAVPLGVRARLLFGGVPTQLGWLFICVGMLVVWIFAADSELVTMFRFEGTLEHTPGTVVESHETTSSENKQQIIAIHYRFVDEGGTHDGVSYTTGEVPKPASEISVEFPSGDPEHSRIVGMRDHRFGLSSAFVFVFPIIGLMLAARGLRSGKQASELLARGCVARGRLCGRAETNVLINDKPVMALTFEFEVDGRKYRTTARTATPDALTDEETEQLVYAPSNPRRATMIDHLPGAPRIDEDGRFAEVMPIDTIVFTALPAIAVIELVAFVWLAIR